SPTTAAIATTAAPTATPTPTTASSAGASTAPTPPPQPTLLPPIPGDTTAVTLTKIAIPPLSGKTASIDLIVIDQEAHRLYAADRTTNGVDVFDVTTKDAKYLKTVDAGSGANGVVVAKNVNTLSAAPPPTTPAILPPPSLTLLPTAHTARHRRAAPLHYDPQHTKLHAHTT